ncbi:hypothetical protein OsccyDRAFT_2030 [Leptolyngbyaceae cyanobacterium JSC-12]|nr:hypothetical protein OsccyDRAFT_2030 [Leptolyngbyaceae cyanobacterium JSC-12]
MVHTYEVFVDIREFIGYPTNSYQSGTARYEVDAESIGQADDIACTQARKDYPRGVEYDPRVTKLLK